MFSPELLNITMLTFLVNKRNKEVKDCLPAPIVKKMSNRTIPIPMKYSRNPIYNTTCMNARDGFRNQIDVEMMLY